MHAVNIGMSVALEKSAGRGQWLYMKAGVTTPP